MQEPLNKLALLSIEDILPQDVIQHIISFIHINPKHIKAVNKTFKTLCNINENIQLKQRENEIVSKIGTTSDNNTWIIHPTRKLLDKKETALGYKGPKNNLKDALQVCKSGDKIIIYDGQYTVDNDTFPIDKNYQLIGYGKNATLGCEDELGETILHLHTAKVYLKNLKLSNIYIEVTNGSTLWMEHCCCRYEGGILVEVYNNANLYVFNCLFGENGSGEDCGAIATNVSNVNESTGDVFVINCKFIECGGYNNSPCIEIEKGIESKVRVIGNKFKIVGTQYEVINATKLIRENLKWQKHILDNNEIVYINKCDEENLLETD